MLAGWGAFWFGLGRVARRGEVGIWCLRCVWVGVVWVCVAACELAGAVVERWGKM